MSPRPSSNPPADPHSLPARIGQAIKAAREKAGWTQQQLAAAAEIGQSYISEIEAGLRNPSAMTLVNLAECLGVEAAELLPRTFPPKRGQKRKPRKA